MLHRCRVLVVVVAAAALLGACGEYTEEDWTEDLKDEGVPIYGSFEDSKVFCTSKFEDGVAMLTPVFGSEDMAADFMRITYRAC